jgi:hypothetical protein
MIFLMFAMAVGVSMRTAFEYEALLPVSAAMPQDGSAAS